MFRTRYTSRIVLVSLALVGFNPSCDKATEPPPPGEEPLALELLDASCTEVWISVKLVAAAQPRTIEIKRDTVPILTTTLTGTDTLIVDDGLLPNREYTYTLTRPGVWQSQPLTAMITTMDTTSHDWVFDQPVLLGDGGGSVLYDVAIINDTLAYAVGAIYKMDSLGNWDPNAYNLVKWDGNGWELIRIPFIGPCSAVDYPPLRAIWAISANQILVTNGGAIATYNGTTASLDCRMNSLLAGAINKLFATGPEDIYAVGNNGTIVHYSSGTWRRVESGVTLRVQDTWGVRNATGDQKVIAVASNKFTNDGVAVTALHAGSVQSLSVAGLPTTSVVGVWSANGLQYHVCGDGLYVSNNLHGGWREIAHGAAPIYMEAVRGIAPNDIVVAGDFGFLIHWNGVRWREYSNNVLPYFAGQYEAVDVKAQLMVAVGWLNNGRAIMLTGRR